MQEAESAHNERENISSGQKFLAHLSNNEDTTKA